MFSRIGFPALSSETGAVDLSYPFGDVRRYGAKGDGLTNDTAAIQAAIAACSSSGGGGVFFPSGTFLCVAAVTFENGVTLIGSGVDSTILKASASSTALVLVDGVTKTGIGMQDMQVDANGAARNANIAAMGCVRFFGCTDVHLSRVRVTGARGPTGGGSTVGLSFSEALRVQADCVSAIACGTAARPSDGVFCSGSQILFTNYVADSIYDTAFVLQNANNSGLSGFVMHNVSASVNISAPGSDNLYGNFIENGSIYNDDTSMPGTMGLGTYGSGNLIESRISGVTLICNPPSAANMPGFNVIQASTGRVDGAVLSDIAIRGNKLQGMALRGDNITISNPHIVNDYDIGIHAIDVAGLDIVGGRIESSSIGMVLSGNVSVHGTHIVSVGRSSPVRRMTYGIVYGIGDTPANQLVQGVAYYILAPGTTNWTALGAANNLVDTRFFANASGTGTGTGRARTGNNGQLWIGPDVIIEGATVSSLRRSDGNIDLLAFPSFQASNLAASVLAAGMDAGAYSSVSSAALVASLTIEKPINPSAGHRLAFCIKQDAIGGRSVTWNAVFIHQWSNAGNGASKRSSIAFIFDGVNWNQDGAQGPWI